MSKQVKQLQSQTQIQFTELKTKLETLILESKHNV